MRLSKIGGTLHGLLTVGRTGMTVSSTNCQVYPTRHIVFPWISARPRIPAHPPGYNVGKRSSRITPPPFSLIFLMVGTKGKLLSIATLFTTFYDSTTAESVQENGFFFVPVISISLVSFEYIICSYIFVLPMRWPNKPHPLPTTSLIRCPRSNKRPS